jgi:AraC family transcriptional regulator
LQSNVFNSCAGGYPDGGRSNLSTSSEITLGLPRSLVATPDLNIADVDYPPNARFHPHIHNCGYIACVLRGGWTDTVKSQSRTARSGTVIIMPEGERHENSIGPGGARAVLITIPGRFDGRYVVDRWQHWAAPKLSQILFRVHYAHAIGGEAELDTCRELLFAFFEHLAVVDMARNPGSRACVMRARQIMDASFQGSLRLSDIAHQVNCDFAYLSRAFRIVMRCTMGEYLRAVRAKHAACLLTSTPLPISDIAARCGFSDQSHMTRVFKSAFGLPPARYRQFSTS